MEERRIFVIGDSISIHYGPYLKDALGEEFKYDRKRGIEDALRDLDKPIGANAGDSKMVLNYIKEQEQKGITYDILLINCGLHDIRVDRESKEYQVYIKGYEENLRAIVKVAKKIARQIIWIGLTPIIDEVHNNRDGGFFRFGKDVVNYDELAKKIMKSENVKVIDLFNFTKALGGREIYFDHVHYKEAVRRLQGEFISSEIKK